MRKIFIILFALVLALSMSLVAVPVGASPADGDVTIVVQDQAGSPIEGATARLVFYGGGKGGYSMDGKTTDATGSATFTATEIATWLTAEGYNPSSQIYAQPGAKVETDSAYGKVRTVDPTTGFLCIPYNTPGGTLVPKPAMSFTYKMIMMSTEPVQTVWDDPTNNFTVTATLADSLSVTPDVTKIRLIRNLVGGQPPAPGGSDDDWYMWNGTAYERWKGIATVDATATGASVSATFSQGIFSDWLVGNKIVVKPEFGVNRTVDSVSCIDDYYAVDILRPSAYIHPAQINDTDLFYPTIQDAIDAAVAYDTINVAAGTYDEQVVIDKSLTLQGVGDTTIIQPSGPVLTATTSIPWIGGGTGPMSAIVSVEATGGTVIIKDLKIDGSLITSKSTTWVGGLVYLETSGKVEGVTVIGNSALPDRTAGIFAAAITESASLEITGCTVIGYNRAGIYALGGEFTADYHHNVINGPGTLSTGVPNGMYFLEGATGSATYNTITDLGYTGETWRSAGIGTYPGTGSGITFAHNTISNVQNAFALRVDGTTVEYNTIYNCHTGVRIGDDATNSIIQYNDMHDNDFAIRGDPDMGDGNVAHYNNFVNHPGLEETVDGATYEGAVCNLHPTFILDATLNWWGAASGPTHATNTGGVGDAISDNVKYSPWWGASYLTGTAPNITLVPHPWTWHVNTTGGSSPGAIQEGIDVATAGDTIIVHAGTYDEQVVIDKSLTLQGVGDTTIIQPPAVQLTPTSNIPWIPTGTATMAAIVSVETTGGTVIIKDLKIDGSLIPSKATTWVSGLVYLETSGKVEGLSVIGNSALPDRTAGIFAAAITYPASLEVTGCTVIGYNRAGIYALGGEFTADYHHNEINGPGSISTGVPNGMFFLRGATGSATYNTVTDLGYTGETYRSTGIGTYSAGDGIVFSHNEISNVQNAFALSNNTNGTTVEYNTIYDCHTGVRLESGTNNNIIQYNDILNNTYAIRASPSGGDNEAHFNNFVGNTGSDAEFPTYVGAVSNVDETNTLDATYNWWGDDSGPSGVGPGTGDAVSDYVDFEPWLVTDPTVTTQAATEVRFLFATMNMNYTVGGYSSAQVRFAYKESTDTEWSYTNWVSKSVDGTYAWVLSRLAHGSQYAFKTQLKYDDIVDGETVIEGDILQFTTSLIEGCFIATAAYGTSTAEQIDVLREFRDMVLLESTVGSQFVALYYQLSPPVADFIAGSSFLRTLVRELLVDPIVWVVEATGDMWQN